MYICQIRYKRDPSFKMIDIKDRIVKIKVRISYIKDK